MTSRVPFSGTSLAAHAMPNDDAGTCMCTVVVPMQSSMPRAAAAAVATAPPSNSATDGGAYQAGFLRCPLPLPTLGSGVSSGAAPALASAPLISGSHDRHWQSPLFIASPQSAPPPSAWESEETGVVAPAEIDHGTATGSGAEEDEVARQDEAPVERCGVSRDAQRLYVHPLAAAAASGVSLAFPPPADPITAALARQNQQQHRGESRSPLSSRTLQALYAACAEGRRSSFLAQLTADDVLAPPPLALTWYPSVPSGVTKFADRKRTVDGVTVATMHQHEKSMLDEEEHDAAEMTSTGVSPPSRRPRTEEFTVPVAELPSISPCSSVAASLCVCTPPLGADSVGCRTKRGDSAAASVHANAYRKRDRDERVYEYLSHGRRLR
ncbi:hypothetical protein, unknown function [Leishmania braziliensis MHOM/BR/75/M2904]|uniref:Uncharacterized protein n=2 Tax=Leishmania braziliensis TaxID=5660 RepID=A4HBQ6_LEIBR|nr:hypothetical protein, unknown function [Leishmania braziliensis MHOM/BR/75/M2904]CAJ2472429.1 unnamed protein product [Leishmania braziliensis]CAM38845.2 hypothetical protein, unknown function [Leishmania braziliensis MHOM/BR/75/M2904]SYZ65666.1 hypothetical_protein [Leishmania braziliensis MHOM/BR/75/M2904]